MQTLYVDVYFLINFTVDLIASYLSVKILHIKSSIHRLVLLSAIGGVLALVDTIFVNGQLISAALLIVFTILSGLLVSKELSVNRRAKFVIVFFCVMMLIGGIVGYCYTFLESYLSNLDGMFSDGEQNRSALIFSLIILITIGVLKLFIMMFTNGTRHKSQRIRITLGEKSIECDALVDSGNLVKDPMTMNPVVFLKPDVARRLVPREILELSDLDRLDSSMRRRIRLIPITSGGATHVVTGVLPDSVVVLDSNHVVDVTLGIDKEGGTFGGYEALIPSSVTEL